VIPGVVGVPEGVTAGVIGKLLTPEPGAITEGVGTTGVTGGTTTTGMGAVAIDAGNGTGCGGGTGSDGGEATSKDTASGEGAAEDVEGAADFLLEDFLLEDFFEDDDVFDFAEALRVVTLPPTGGAGVRPPPEGAKPVDARGGRGQILFEGGKDSSSSSPESPSSAAF
jgi:hypothetical protein